MLIPLTTALLLGCTGDSTSSSPTQVELNENQTIANQQNTNPQAFVASPTALSGVSLSDSAISLAWHSPSSSEPVSFTIHRDGVLIGTTSENQFIDSGLQSNLSYEYRITATDNRGNQSEAVTLVVTTNQSVQAINVVNAEALLLNAIEASTGSFFSDLTRFGFIGTFGILASSVASLSGYTELSTTHLDNNQIKKVFGCDIGGELHVTYTTNRSADIRSEFRDCAGSSFNGLVLNGLLEYSSDVVQSERDGEVRHKLRVIALNATQGQQRRYLHGDVEYTAGADTQWRLRARQPAQKNDANQPVTDTSLNPLSTSEPEPFVYELQSPDKHIRLEIINLNRTVSQKSQQNGTTDTAIRPSTLNVEMVMQTNQLDIGTVRVSTPQAFSNLSPESCFTKGIMLITASDNSQVSLTASSNNRGSFTINVTNEIGITSYQKQWDDAFSTLHQFPGDLTTIFMQPVRTSDNNSCL